MYILSEYMYGSYKYMNYFTTIISQNLILLRWPEVISFSEGGITNLILYII